MIDIHNHLGSELLQYYHKPILSNCKKLGVSLQVVNGTCENDWEKISDLTKQFSPQIIPSYGLHPWKIESRTSKWLTNLENYLKQSNAWVGEIGIDFIKGTSPQKEQEKVFIQQLELAHTYKCPATIHCIKSWGRLLKIFQEHKQILGSFILHSYGGSKEMIPQFEELGAFFSYSASITNPARKKQIDALKNTPLNRLFLETDSPSQTPNPHYIVEPLPNGLNSPANIIKVYSFAAAELGCSKEFLINQCRSNMTKCVQLASGS